MASLVAQSGLFWILFLVYSGVVSYLIIKLNKISSPLWAIIPFFGGILFAIMAGAYYSKGFEDIEVINTHIVDAQYYEEWVEYYYVTVCAAHDKNGNCTSWRVEKRTTYHAPYWEINYGTGYSEYIPSSLYRKYANDFGEKYVTILRLNKDSGPGNKYVSTVPVGKIPASYFHTYTNYVKASELTIQKHTTKNLVYGGMIYPYPNIVGNEYGNIDFQRVILSNLNYDGKPLKLLDRYLDDALVYLGPSRQVNIVVYLVGNTDQEFFEELQSVWIKGKKNDCVAVVGIQDKNIVWSNIMAWTDNELFKVKLKNAIVDLKRLETDDDFKKLGEIIVKQISADGDSGYIRKPMADFEYLKYDVELSGTQEIVIGIIFAIFLIASCFLIIRVEV